MSSVVVIPPFTPAAIISFANGALPNVGDPHLLLAAELEYPQLLKQLECDAFNMVGCCPPTRRLQERRLDKKRLATSTTHCRSVGNFVRKQKCA